MDTVIEVINHNTKLKVYFITNVQGEFSNHLEKQHDEIYSQLKFIKNLGLTKTVHSLIPRHRVSPSIELCKPYIIAELPCDTGGRHQQPFYREQLLALIQR
jgi:hypothetical protein